MSKPKSAKTKGATILFIAAMGALAVAALGYVLVLRDPGRTRTPCHEETHVASPGWFSDGWCLQRHVTIEQTDGAETGWAGDRCFPTEQEARAACERGAF